MKRYRIEVGHNHKVKPGNIVGAIANEAGIDSQHIGRINIHENYSLIDLPEGMPKDIFNDLKKVWVSGQQLKISHLANERSPGKSDNRVNNEARRRKLTKKISKKKVRKK